MPRARNLFLHLALGVIVASLAGCSSISRVPVDGRYDGELCVTSGNNPASCGPIDVSLANARIKVRVSDFTYDLLLQDGELDLMLVHGTTLVDVFTAPYSWAGHLLRFVDVDRRVAYQMRFAASPRDPTAASPPALP